MQLRIRRVKVAVILVGAALVLGFAAQYRLAALDSRFRGIVRFEFPRWDDPSTMRRPILQVSFPAFKGLTLYLFGDYAGAARAYREHLRNYGEFGDFGDPMEAAMARGELTRARQLAEEALRRDEGDGRALLTLGKLALDDGRYEEGLRFFERVLARHTDQFDALLLSSVARSRTGEYDKAIDALKRALRHYRIEDRRSSFLAALEVTGELGRRPANQLPLCLLAHYHRYLRIFDEEQGYQAIRYANEAIAAGDRPDDAWVVIGVVYVKWGKRQESLEAFKKALAANPRNPDALLDASLTYGQMGDFANENRFRMEAAEAGGTDSFYAGAVANLLIRKLGDYRRAREYFLQRLNRYPESADDLERVGEASSLLGDYDQALGYLRRALTLRPDSPQGLEWLAYALRETGKLEEAEAALRKAIRIDPSRSSTYTELGSVYIQQHREEEAIEMLEQAVALGEVHATQVAALCTLYDRAHRYRSAVNCYRWVFASDPGDPMVRAKLSMAERRLAWELEAERRGR